MTRAPILSRAAALAHAAAKALSKVEHREIVQRDSLGDMYVACCCGRVFWSRDQTCREWADWVSSLHREEYERMRNKS